jgi:hypothetical protein
MSDEHDGGPGTLPYEKTPPFVASGGWINVRVRGRFVEFRFPDVCCWCMEETTDRVELKTATMYDACIPLCATCRDRWRARRRRVNWIVTGAVVGITAIWYWISDARYHGGQLAFQSCTIAAAFSFLLCLVLGDRLGHPVKTSLMTRYSYSGYADIKFKNANYPALLTPGNVRPEDAPVSDAGIPVRFPVPPKKLKEGRRK